MKGLRWRYFARVAGIGFALLGIVQLIRPRLDNPPITAEMQTPPRVKQVLRDRCYQCHSNETKLPWFDQIVPAYWIVTHDVKEARAHLNFSTIGSQPLAIQRATLYEGVNQVQLGAMPLPSYLAVHRDSRVTPGDLQILKDYLSPFAPATEATATPAADTSPVNPSPVNSSRSVRPSLNGVPFFPEYRNWRIISTTDRGDNQTLRIITANDVAVRAIDAHQTNPWPDGTVMAKIAIRAVHDGRGNIRAGDFIQVEFMEKDKAKYASSAGWGWARWRGADLKPYGKDAKFADECVGCHRPLAGIDYVYTLPIPREPGEPNLPYPILDWRAITLGVDRQRGTMYAVLGNAAAVQAAHSANSGPYPDGSILAVLTWKQRDDPHWFGARIADQPLAVEFVKVQPGGHNEYQLFTGSSLGEQVLSKQVLIKQASLPDPERIAAILSERGPFLP